MSLSTTGLSIPSQADIEESIKTSIKADLGPQIQLNDDSITGRMIKIIAYQIAQAYEVLRAIYDALSPDQAEGAWLDLVAALAGLTREPASSSIGIIRIDGIAATTIPIGARYRVPNGPIFETTEGGTIPLGLSRVDLAIRCTETGAIQAGAGTITEPVTIIAGVATVTNDAAVIEGREIESDTALRRRLAGSYARAGAGTIAAIRSAVLGVASVDQCLVIENDTDAVDALGLPRHSFRVVLWPAQTDNDPVWLAVWGTAPAGSKSDGWIAGLITDSQGVSQGIAYSLADEQQLYINVSVTSDPLTYGGDAAIEAAVLAWASALEIGQDVLVHKIEAAIAEVTGILTLEVLVAVGAQPTALDDVNITIDFDAIATADATNLVIIS